jgi:hypothetical protein
MKAQLCGQCVMTLKVVCVAGYSGYYSMAENVKLYKAIIIH